jgi:HD-GYP domain-containing protein (c-di-GMP phosphodiesterase class II)
MEAFAIKDLKPEVTFTKPVYLDQKYILLTPDAEVTPELIRSLIQWEFREVYTDGEAREKGDLETVESMPEFDGKLSAETAAAVAPAKDASTSLSGEDAETFTKVQAYYQSFLNYVDGVFTKYVTKDEINLQDISDKVKDLSEYIKQYKRYILRIQDSGRSDKNYLVSHSVKTCILSIVIGSYLKLQSFKIIELGVTALLHEIGMVRLPPQLYMTDKPLSPQEKKSIITHPVLGYTILKKFSFPLAICLGALEHHERNSGKGYPRGLTAEKISPYAKIIAVACSYDAVTSSRPYKEARDGYSGIVDILRNEGKQYEENVIRALVYSLSMFPIGSYVALTDGRVALVVDANAENPRCPIVSVVGNDGRVSEQTIKTQAGGLCVKRVLSKAEVQGFIKK